MVSHLKVPEHGWGHHPDAGKFIEGLKAQTSKLDFKKPSWFDKAKNKMRSLMGSVGGKVIGMVKASVKKWLKRSADKSGLTAKMQAEAQKAEEEAKEIVADVSKNSIEVVTAINKHLKSTALAGFAGVDQDLDEMIKAAIPCDPHSVMPWPGVYATCPS